MPSIIMLFQDDNYKSHVHFCIFNALTHIFTDKNNCSVLPFLGLVCNFFVEEYKLYIKTEIK